MRKRFRPAIFSAISADVPYVKCNRYNWERLAEANPRIDPPSP